MHLAVDYVTPRLPDRPRRIARSGIHLLVAALSVILTVFGVRLLPVASLQVSPALGVSMVWAYLAVPVSGLLLTLVAGSLIVSENRR